MFFCRIQAAGPQIRGAWYHFPYVSVTVDDLSDKAPELPDEGEEQFAQ